MWDVILRALFEIPETAANAEAGDMLRAGVNRYLYDESANAADAVADLFGLSSWKRNGPVEGDGEAVVSRGVGALSRLLTAVANEPLLIIVSHANRGSSSSLALMGALEASLKDRPAMLLLTGTPELTRILPG